MKYIKPYLLLLPQIFVGIIFLVGIGIGITQSFGVVPVFNLYKPTFKYYTEIFMRKDTLDSIFYSLKVAFVSSFISIILGILICFCMVYSGKDKGFMLNVTKIPILVPHVIVALMLVNIISQNGLLARILYQLGFIKEQSDFPLIIFDKAGAGVILAYLWKEVPFVIYFIISLMSAVSSKLAEAAVNLGAGRVEAFFKITLPLCYNTIISAFLIIFAYSLGAYELPLLMGATVPKALPIMAYIEFQKPDLRLRPYAMAYNGILIVISMLAAIIYFMLLKKTAKEAK